jgi:hypothetical protein
MIASCGKNETPPPQNNQWETNQTETNTVDIGNKPVIEITEANVQPIR